jgi:hypothetical protein
MKLRQTKNKKIFVYDTTAKFSEFIIEQYVKTFSVDVCENMKSIDNYNYSAYDIFFIIATEPKDVTILFKTINNMHSTLFLGSSLKEIREKFQENKRITTLDLLKPRNEMIRFIDTNIN